MKIRNDPGRKKIQKLKDASPGGRAASSQPVNGPDRRLAHWPANSPAGQRGNTGASQRAASRPVGWSASQAASQVAASLGADRQPSGAITGGLPQSNFWTTVSQKTAKTRKKKKADPGRNKNWVNTPAGRLVDCLVSQQLPASCPSGQ